MSIDTWQSALASRSDLLAYGDNAIGLFSLGLRFNIDDLVSVAADAVTDGSDDKKCDLIYIDHDEQAAVVCQCFMSKFEKAAAPSNKASDLNTAVAWLLQTPIKNLPARIKSSAASLRDALTAGTVSDLHIWYVHNLPESKNVADELHAVENAAGTAIKAHFPGKNVRLAVKEVGTETLASWYADSLTPILVTDTFRVVVPAGFPVETADWKAYVTAFPAAFLHRLYKKYKTKLFSANVRDYLGSRKSDQNINHGIKLTAETDPQNFWVYNNGLTLLVNDFSPVPYKGMVQLTIAGLSIVNGAQTTGAIGSLKKSPDPLAHVPVRLIKTSNREVIYDIIRFNNSQNKVTAPDFRSTDRVQKRLKEEMSRLPLAEYEGGRRGGHEDIIRRRTNLLPSYTVGQALAALHGDAVIAYNQKSDIWILDNLYARYFNDETTAAHIVFAYSLLRAVESRKGDLVQKSKQNANALTSAEQRQLEFFRNRGATYLLASAIAACGETFLAKRILSVFKLSFAASISPALAEQHWQGIVLTTAPLCSHLEDAFTDGLKNSERVRKAIQTFQSLVEVTANSNERIYKEFASKVQIRL